MGHGHAMSEVAVAAPRLYVLLMEGCSGSTFVIATARRLLHCAGVETSNLVRDYSELLKPSTNPWYRAANGSWPAALESMQRVAADRGGAFLIKADLHSGSSPIHEWAPALRRLGGVVAEGHRVNRLDLLLCMCVRAHVCRPYAERTFRR